MTAVNPPPFFFAPADGERKKDLGYKDVSTPSQASFRLERLLRMSLTRSHNYGSWFDPMFVWNTAYL